MEIKIKIEYVTHSKYSSGLMLWDCCPVRLCSKIKIWEMWISLISKTALIFYFPLYKQNISWTNDT